MDEAVTAARITRAQAGDQRAREELIVAYRDEVARAAAVACRRRLDWTNDDELSLAMIALNEAIDSFDPGRNASFRTYARMVARHRLIDHFRREVRERHAPLMWMAPDAAGGAAREPDGRVSPYELEAAEAAYWEAQERAERADELAAFERLLGRFGLTLADLVQASPKHRDTRHTLIQAARALAAQPELVARFKQTRQLPLKDLQALTGISRKVLENGRRYLVAIALILVYPEFDHLREHIRWPVAKVPPPRRSPANPAAAPGIGLPATKPPAEDCAPPSTAAEARDTRGKGGFTPWRLIQWGW